jgi:hypothetical protein
MLILEQMNHVCGANVGARILSHPRAAKRGGSAQVDLPPPHLRSSNINDKYHEQGIAGQQYQFD